ncbi:deoxynucleotide monophosphate kinase family protein [Streptomyces sp. NPDC054849]
MNNALLVGLAGFARSGKDSAAQVLVEGGWRRDAFADRLKTFLYRQNPLVTTYPDVPPVRLVNLVAAYGWDGAKEKFPEVRRLLHATGTDAGRVTLGEDVWVDALLRDYEAEREALVVSDVRFPNEARAIRALGGVVIWIERPGVGPAKDANGLTFTSEVALRNWQFDATLVNDGDLDDLRDRLLGVTVLAEHFASAA